MLSIRTAASTSLTSTMADPSEMVKNDRRSRNVQSKAALWQGQMNVRPPSTRTAMVQVSFIDSKTSSLFE
jgi:hypothetical protein